ncbi:MAG: serine hydrolase domain-containing protein [Pseudomonadales bacterium]
MSFIEIHGYCAPGFAPVKDAFAENFSNRGEAGAAFSVYRCGDRVVDIWAGTRDRHDRLPWQEDTIVNVFSASKGVVALCALQLQEQGLLDFTEPVARYWPEFAAHGKADIRIEQVLCHRSGLAAIWQDIEDSRVYDWQAMVEVMEQERPYWPPGSAQGYQVFTYGWLVGELIRRVSGLSVGNYIQQHISLPLGLDFYIGVTDDQFSRIADVAPRPPKNTKKPVQRADKSKEIAVPGRSEARSDRSKKPDSIAARALTTPESLFKGTNSSAWRRAEIPAGNGHSDARSLARLYAALADDGQLNGIRLLKTATLPLCSAEMSNEIDRVLGISMRFGPGFMLYSEPGFAFGGPRSFGHTGNGGSLAFADPDIGLGLAYVTNRLANGDRRSRVLVDATYQCVAVG